MILIPVYADVITGQALQLDTHMEAHMLLSGCPMLLASWETTTCESLTTGHMLPTRRFNEEDGVSWDQKIASLIDARVLQLKHYATRHQDSIEAPEFANYCCLQRSISLMYSISNKTLHQHDQLSLVPTCTSVRFDDSVLPTSNTVQNVSQGPAELKLELCSQLSHAGKRKYRNLTSTIGLETE